MNFEAAREALSEMSLDELQELRVTALQAFHDWMPRYVVDLIDQYHAAPEKQRSLWWEAGGHTKNEYLLARAADKNPERFWSAFDLVQRRAKQAGDVFSVRDILKQMRLGWLRAK